RDRPLRADALDRLLTGEGRDVRAYRHPGRAVARRRGRRQEAGTHQLHRAPALDGAVGPEAGAEDRPAAPAVRRRVHPPAARPVLVRPRPRRDPRPYGLEGVVTTTAVGPTPAAAALIGITAVTFFVLDAVATKIASGS